VERVKDNIDDERGKRIKSQDEILKFKDNIYNSLLKFNKSNSKSGFDFRNQYLPLSTLIEELI
jgi:hypothetical protein